MLSLLAPSRPDTSRAAPVLVGPGAVRAGAMFGLSDEGGPTIEQQRTAYRGLVAMASRIRAGRVGQALAEAKAQREARPGERDDVEVAHPWARLLRAPHPSLSPRALWSWVQQAKDLGRGAFLSVERDGAGRPVALHPVHPSFGSVEPFGDAAGAVAGYVFLRADGERQTWEARDVIWIRHPHPLSPYESASLLEITAYEADTDLYSRIYLRDLLRRGGAPKLQITSDQPLTARDADELSDRLSPRVLNQGQTQRLPIFGKGARVETIGLSGKDMEFVETAGLTRRDLLQIWGIPEGLFSDRANRANAEAAQYILADLTIMPEVDDACDQLTTQLRVAFEPAGRAPSAGTLALVVTPPDVVPLDPDFQLRQDEVRLRTAQRAVNELRERDGLQPVEGGDTPLTSAVMTPLASLATGQGVYLRPDASGGSSSNEGGEEASRTLALVGTLRRAGVSETEDTRTTEWRAVDRVRRGAERPVEAAALAYLSRMAEDVAGRILNLRSMLSRGGARKEGTPDVSAPMVFNLDEWTEALALDLGPAFAEALGAGFRAGAARVGVELTFDASRPSVRAALARTLELASSVPETMQDEIADAIRAGLDADETLEQIAARVRAHVEDMAGWKARQIAQTSGTRAFEAGQVESYTEAGVEEKGWLSQRDGKVRASHSAIDGEVVPVGQAFSNGQMHPGEDVNCRCTTFPVIAERSARRGDSPQAARDRYIVEQYPVLLDKHGREVALTQLRDEIASRAPAGWAPIGERQILRIAKGHRG